MAFDQNREDIADLLLDYGAEPFQGKLFSNDETTPFERDITHSNGRLVPRMLGQDSAHPLGKKSVQKPKHLKQPRQGLKTSAEILSQRGVELATSAAQRGELEALTSLLRAGVNISAANTSRPTILQAYSLAANANARNLPGVTGQWQRIQDRLKADYLTHANAVFVSSLHAQESSLSNQVVTMAPDRWYKIRDVLVDHGAIYDAFAATALGDAKQANNLIARDKNVVQARDGNNETPLHWAVHTEQPALLALWLSAGVPLDATNAAGQTALHLAAAGGQPDDVKTLLAAKASTTIRDTNGWTALDAAIQNRQSDCIHLLLPANPAAPHPERGFSLSLHEAAAAGNVASLVAILETETNLEARNELGLTPLQLAVTKGHLAAAALLVDQGANVKVCDPAGNSLLHQILLQDQLTIYDRPPTNWLERVGQDPSKKSYVQYLTVGPYEQDPNALLQAASFLLACGADATAKNSAGDTPMQLIVNQKTGRGVFFFDNDREKLLQLLSVHGSDLDARDADGNTALHRLCTSFYDITKVETMVSLIASGANVNATNNLGQTPLHIAAQNIGGWDNNDPPVNEPFQLLVYKKADVNARDNQGRTPLHVVSLSDSSFKDQATRLLIAAGANPNLQDNEGMTPLHLVAKAGKSFSEGAVQGLLDAGANPNLRDNHGRTPAHWFLLGAWPWSSAGACLSELAAAKADFNIKDDKGKTPLHYLAAQGSHRPLFFIRGIDQILEDAKVDFQAKDNEGNTPASIAAKAGTQDVFDWLVKKGADLDTTNQLGETARLVLAHRPDNTPGLSLGNVETDIFQAAREGNVDAANRLLKADPSLVNRTNQFQQSTLRMAVMQQQTGMVDLLESHGAVWDAGTAVLARRTNELAKLLKQDPAAAGQKIFGKGLLATAVANNDLADAQLLVAAHADVNGTDTWKLSPLGYALINHQPEMEAFLRRHGAKENLFDAIYADDLNTAKTLLEQDKSLVKGSQADRFSPVSIAVTAGRTNILRLLLKHGATIADNHACLAACYNQTGCLALLIRAGAKLDKPDSSGFAPLHWAAIRGSTEAAELLLKHKVDVNQAATDDPRRPSPLMGPDRAGIAGDTPLHLAALCGETNLVALLLQAGADVNAANAGQLTPLDLADTMRLPSMSVRGLQSRLIGLPSPLDNQPNPVANMHKTMAGRRVAAEIIKAAGGKQSSNYHPFGNPF